MDIKKTNAKIRSTKKKLRRELAEVEQRAAGRHLSLHSRAFMPLLRAKRILSYLPFAGEIRPDFLEKQLCAAFYLPKITLYREGQMKFYPANSKRRINSLGINEPTGEHVPIDARSFDLALVPLVAFSRDGNRLGMGAGFYDRAFAFRNNKHSIKRPLLVGLAHHFQEVSEIKSQAWDVGLDAIITDRELIIT